MASALGKVKGSATMRDPSRIYRWTLLVSSLLTLVLLLAAAFAENFRAQWYRVQREYRDLLEQKATDETGRELARNFRLELKQVAIPALGAVDRCVTCHNGIDDPRMRDVVLPHRVHSGDVLRAHPPDRFGCTVCHQGQGLATNFRDAKAEDAFWDYPLLPRELTQATCVTCHDPVYLAEKSPAQVERLLDGMRLFDEKSCGSCHKLGGRGGVLGRPLDNVGLRTKHQFILSRLSPPHTTWRWHQAHLLDPQGIVPGSQMVNPRVTEEEAEALTTFLLSLRQRDVPESYVARDKIEQKFRELRPKPRTGAELYRSFCAACHLPEGQGSNYRALGVRAPAIGSADFLDVATDDFILRTLEAGRPERKMPAMAAPNDTLSPEEAKSLVAFLRARAPRAPSLAEVERARSDSALGERTYRADCAGCHGDRGQGSPLGSPLATRDRKAATRAALYRAVAEGVPGTAMPRYSNYDALTLRSLLDFTASLPEGAGTRTGWKRGSGDSENGGRLFARTCSGCHGMSGEGKTGPGLATPGFLSAASEEFIAATIVRGRAGTPMPAFGRDSASFPKFTAQEVLDLAAFVRNGLVAGARPAASAARGRFTSPLEATPRRPSPRATGERNGP
jgi:mono/diheme cytochrome c family protein